MKIFNLPDLGEGLPDAEIVEWHVKAGDHIITDTLLVSMETAKAVVDVPAPYTGIIEKLYGQAGDVIKTGAPLVSFASEEITDSGTIAGELERGDEIVIESARIGSAGTKKTTDISRATPAIRSLARHLNVDLSSLHGDGIHGTITHDQVIAATKAGNSVTQTTPSATKKSDTLEGYEPLQGTRRHMAHLMEQSRAEVVAVSIFDDVIIDTWAPKTDITVRLLRAIVRACHEEPALNAFYHGPSRSRKIFSEVHLGLAMDTPDGLFVPVLNDVEKFMETDPQRVRSEIQTLKEEVNARTIAPEKLRGATITLSNFGNFAGRYATPIIVPPQVAIIGAGKIRKVPVAHNNEIKIHRVLPLSLSMDHRAVTGGEATRFLGILMRDLALEN